MIGKRITAHIAAFLGVIFMRQTSLGEGMPMIPIIPAAPIEKVDEETREVWELKKIKTLMMESRVKVVIPLEIISDVEIKAAVIDEEVLNVPFEIELNKKPDKENYYALKYSKKELDIDGDGKVDSRIYSPEYINEQIVRDNYLNVDGKNITREGVHRAKVYVTVEVKEK